MNDIEYQQMSDGDILKHMNQLERRIEKLIGVFEKTYPDWTVECDSYSVWGPVMKEDQRLGVSKENRKY